MTDYERGFERGANFQLEEVLEWLNKTILERGPSYEAINIPEDLLEAMRPTTQEDNND